MSDRSNPIFLFRVAGNIEISSVDNPRLISFEFEEADDGGKIAEVSVWDGDYKLLDDPKLKEGLQCSWRFGYHDGPLSPLFRGTIIELKPVFDISTDISLTIRAAATGELELMRGVRRKTWQKATPDMRASEVVQAIASDLGMKSIVEKTAEVKRSWSQTESDFDFIRRLGETARAENPAKTGVYRLQVTSDGTTLIWRPAQVHAKPKRAFNYFVENNDPEIINLSINTRPFDPKGGAQDSVLVVGYNQTKGRNESYLAINQSELNRPVAGGGKVSLSLLDGSKKIGKVVTAGVGHDNKRTIADFEAAARQEFARAELDESLDAAMEILLDPTVRRGDVVELRNISRYSGNFLVNAQRVVIDDHGARQELELKRAAPVRSEEFGLERVEGVLEGGDDPIESNDNWLTNLIFGDKPDSGGR